MNTNIEEMRKEYNQFWGYDMCKDEQFEIIFKWFSEKLSIHEQKVREDERARVVEILENSKLPQNSTRNGITTLSYIENESENIKVNNRIDWIIDLLTPPQTSHLWNKTKDV